MIYFYFINTVDLHTFFNRVVKFGGYEETTKQRLWKKLYIDLSGDRSITSAATCARRHYEKLLLPFERFLCERSMMIENGSVNHPKAKKRGRKRKNSCNQNPSSKSFKFDDHTEEDVDGGDGGDEEDNGDSDLNTVDAEEESSSIETPTTITIPFTSSTLGESGSKMIDQNDRSSSKLSNNRNLNDNAKKFGNNPNDVTDDENHHCKNNDYNGKNIDNDEQTKTIEKENLFIAEKKSPRTSISDVSDDSIVIKNDVSSNFDDNATENNDDDGEENYENANVFVKDDDDDDGEEGKNPTKIDRNDDDCSNMKRIKLEKNLTNSSVPIKVNPIVVDKIPIITNEINNSHKNSSNFIIDKLTNNHNHHKINDNNKKESSNNREDRSSNELNPSFITISPLNQTQTKMTALVHPTKRIMEESPIENDVYDFDDSCTENEQFDLSKLKLSTKESRFKQKNSVEKSYRTTFPSLKNYMMDQKSRIRFANDIDEKNITVRNIDNSKFIELDRMKMMMMINTNRSSSSSSSSPTIQPLPAHLGSNKFALNKELIIEKIVNKSNDEMILDLSVRKSSNDLADKIDQKIPNKSNDSKSDLKNEIVLLDLSVKNSNLFNGKSSKSSRSKLTLPSIQTAQNLPSLSSSLSMQQQHKELNALSNIGPMEKNQSISLKSMNIKPVPNNLIVNQEIKSYSTNNTKTSHRSRKTNVKSRINPSLSSSSSSFSPKNEALLERSKNIGVKSNHSLPSISEYNPQLPQFIGSQWNWPNWQTAPFGTIINPLNEIAAKNAALHNYHQTLQLSNNQQLSSLSSPNIDERNNHHLSSIAMPSSLPSQLIPSLGVYTNPNLNPSRSLPPRTPSSKSTLTLTSSNQNPSTNFQSINQSTPNETYASLLSAANTNSRLNSIDLLNSLMYFGSGGQSISFLNFHQQQLQQLQQRQQNLHYAKINNFDKFTQPFTSSITR